MTDIMKLSILSTYSKTLVSKSPKTTTQPSDQAPNLYRQHACVANLLYSGKNGRSARGTTPTNDASTGGRADGRKVLTHAGVVIGFAQGRGGIEDALTLFCPPWLEGGTR